MKRSCGVAVAVLGVVACKVAPIPSSQAYPAGTQFQAVDRVIDGTRLRMIDTGQGPAVVFLHGFGASIYSWRYQLAPVLDAGYRVIAVDLRGFGFSDRPDSGYTNADYVRLALALMDTLGISDAVLVGHSMGAAVAGEVALTAPDRVRGLVLMAPAGCPPLPRELRWSFLAKLKIRLLSRGTVRKTLRHMFADPALVTEADVDQYYAPVVAPGAGSTLRRVISTFRFDALCGRLGGLQVPTMVLWGAADHAIPFEAASRLAHELPRSAFIMVPKAGHNLQEEVANKVNRYLIDFLRNGLPEVPPDLAAAGHSSSGARSRPSRTRGD